MFSVLESVSNLPKGQKCKIDGAVFQLHYTVTVVALIAFFAILTTRQFVGDPVNCIYSSEKIKQEAMDVYCWTHTTYTVPFWPNNSETGHPGVGQDHDPSTFRYHTYYQWVYFVLLLQAALFYAPRFLWLEWEGGRVSTLMEGLRVAALRREEKEDKVEVVLDYLLTTWSKHDWYARRYLICQGLTIVNVLAQYLLLGLFFEENFITLGFRQLHYHFQTAKETSPLYKLFPLVTMCSFKAFGETGETQTTPAICIMPLNIVNKKIYLILWFWFLILIVLSLINIGLDISLHFRSNFRGYALRSKFQFVNTDVVQLLCAKGGVGDWLLLYLLGRNLDFIVFKEVMEKLNVHFVEGDGRNLDDREHESSNEKRKKSFRSFFGI
ncbi:hypothetical protein JTE90_011437 [Oedothorax gibbosus]|uniref:Innexin n=1 Tax=Oedothorax gibbosus TaxID=931172 RepID=A0AAV6VCW1_9ARAC|nr:hypothetical protein JTE90_011437 [Oedothorax gibbosus]